LSGAEIRIDGGGVRLGIVVSRFNEPVTSRLLAGAEACLDELGCRAANRRVHWVPGAWEIPLAAKKLADRGQVDAIVALGALIRGQTPHFDYLGQQVARGLGKIGLDSGIPVIFGVLTTETAEQAFARAGGEHSDKGREAALAALEMVQLFRAMEGN
jgi:6,7-dimethyl-8-ribityllumazine synthase